jgi:cob(I)alamin adenosyltransferase
MSHRSQALNALDDIERAARSLRARLGELENTHADQVERAAAVVEVSRTLRRRADDLYFSVTSEALELGVAPAVLGWNQDESDHEGR